MSSARRFRNGRESGTSGSGLSARSGSARSRKPSFDRIRSPEWLLRHGHGRRHEGMYGAPVGELAQLLEGEREVLARVKSETVPDTVPY